MMETTSDGLAWYAAQLKPNHAKIAERNLVRQGFESFLPMENGTKRKGSKFIDVERPVFPGYIFVGLREPKTSWRAINATYGITKLVSFADKPAELPVSLIDTLKLHYSGREEPFSGPQLAAGDDVRVMKGPFADFIATIERVSPDRRVWVLIDLLQSKVKLEVKAKDVRVLSSARDGQRAVR